MEKATATFAALFLLVIGLSHVAQPRAWVEFYVWLRGKGHTGVFINGFLCLGVGSFIVTFHNIWSGPEILLTLFGWVQVLKGFMNLVMPNVALWGLNRVTHERSRYFIFGGLLTLALSGVLWYVVLSR